MALLPCNPLAGDPCTFSDLGLLLINIFNWLLGLAGLVAFLFIIWGGLQMLLGWFYEEPQNAWTAGKQTIRRAIFGFVLVAAAFFIVNTLLTRILGVGGLNEFFQGIFPD